MCEAFTKKQSQSNPIECVLFFHQPLLSGFNLQIKLKQSEASKTCRIFFLCYVLWGLYN